MSKKIGMDSPWGSIQHVEPYGTEGLCFVETARHGGFYVPPELNKRIPHQTKVDSFSSQGLRGWYEEDCDAAIVMVYSPEFFKPETIARAKESLERWKHKVV